MGYFKHFSEKFVLNGVIFSIKDIHYKNVCQIRTNKKPPEEYNRKINPLLFSNAIDMIVNIMRH